MEKEGRESCPEVVQTEEGFVCRKHETPLLAMEFPYHDALQSARVHDDTGLRSVRENIGDSAKQVSGSYLAAAASTKPGATASV